MGFFVHTYEVYSKTWWDKTSRKREYIDGYFQRTGQAGANEGLFSVCGSGWAGVLFTGSRHRQIPQSTCKALIDGLANQGFGFIEFKEDKMLHNISIADAEFNVPIRAAHLCELPVINEQFDIVLLSSKSYDRAGWLN